MATMEAKSTSATRIFFLNTGLAESLDGKTMAQYMEGGEVLELRLGLSESKAKVIVSNQAIPDGIDMYDGRIYWTCMGTPTENDGLVQSAKLDGSEIVTVIPPGSVHTPKRLSVDAKAKKLYFCDGEGLRVMHCNFDGSEHETIVWNSD